MRFSVSKRGVTIATVAAYGSSGGGEKMTIELCNGKYILKSDAYCMWLSQIKISKDTGR
jgi:hypothetical protein